jgi:hypothetical protein
MFIISVKNFILLAFGSFFLSKWFSHFKSANRMEMNRPFRYHTNFDYLNNSSLQNKAKQNEGR